MHAPDLKVTLVLHTSMHLWFFNPSGRSWCRSRVFICASSRTFHVPKMHQVGPLVHVHESFVLLVNTFSLCDVQVDHSKTKPCRRAVIRILFLQIIEYVE